MQICCKSCQHDEQITIHGQPVSPTRFSQIAFATHTPQTGSRRRDPRRDLYYTTLTQAGLRFLVRFQPARRPASPRRDSRAAGLVAPGDLRGVGEKGGSGEGDFHIICFWGRFRPTGRPASPRRDSRAAGLVTHAPQNKPLRFLSAVLFTKGTVLMPFCCNSGRHDEQITFHGGPVSPARFR